MAKGQKKLKEQALGYLKQTLRDNEEIVKSHEDGLNAYMSEPYGNEVEGRSQVVMTDVQDTIEWIMPTLMKIFYGGSKVTEIKPQGPEDEQSALMMEEKVNFDFMRGINGYTVLHDWFKTALLGKYAVVKYWWEKKKEYQRKEYSDLNEAELQALSQNPDFIVDEVEESVVQEAQMDVLGTMLAPEIKSYKVIGRKVKHISRPVAQALPPEEFIFDKKTVGSLSETEFCAHKKRVHKNYIKSKYKLKDDELNEQIKEFDAGETVKDSRFDDLGGIHFITENMESDFVYIYECYLNEYDDNGTAIPKKVVIFGDRVLEVVDNTYGKPNFCGITTIRIPHRAAGRSLAELVTDLQKLHTALMRAILDNVYYQNNGITVVNPYRINMDDVIDRNEPGAKWRTLYDVDPNSVVAPIQPHPLPMQAFQMLQTVDMLKENRTGITKYNQGLDSKSLNKTATGISQIMGAAQQRMELIARMFAETGVKELFQAFVDMNLMFFDQKTNVRLNEQWVQIDPDSIDGTFDVLIDVGVGTGSQEVKINQLTNMLQMTAPLIQAGVTTPENMQNLLKEIYSLMGHKNTDKFVGGQQGNQQMAMQMQQAQQMIQQLQEQLKMLQQDKQIELMKVRLDEAELALKERLEIAKLNVEQQEIQIKYNQQERFKVIDVQKGVMDGLARETRQGTPSGNANAAPADSGVF